MMHKLKRIKKAAEAEKFALDVQHRLIEQGDVSWKQKIAEYAKENRTALYAGPTVIFIWSNLSKVLRNNCFYQEAFLMGRLAESHSVNLTSRFTDIRIQALTAYGLALIETMRPNEGILCLETAWELAKPGVHDYENLHYMSGQNLAYAYMKCGRSEDAKSILNSLRKWIREENPSAIEQEDILNISLSLLNVSWMKGTYKEGLEDVIALENDIHRLHMEERPIYYKILCLHGLYEKKLNHIVSYYELTKQAVLYAQKAGDRQEEQAYRANLLDALARLGKSEEIFSDCLKITKILEENTSYIDSLNTLQCCMNILIVLLQYPGMAGNLSEVINNIESAWKTMSESGLDWNSRDVIKVKSQFAFIKLMQKDYTQAELELDDCLLRSKEALGEGDVDTLSIMELLAGLNWIQEKYPETACIYQDIKQLRLKYGQGDSYAYFETLRSIAYIYYSMSQKQEAFETIFEYFDCINRYSYEVFGVFDEDAWRTFSNRFFTTLHDLLGWVVASPETNVSLERVYSLVLRFKNRIYDEDMLWKARKRFPVVDQKLSEYYRLFKKPPKLENLQEIEFFLEQKKRLKEEISSCVPEPIELSPSLEELKGILPKGGIILDFVIYNEGLGKISAFRDIHTVNHGYLLFFLTQEKIWFRDLGGLLDLDKDLQELYEEFAGAGDLLEQTLVFMKAKLCMYDIPRGIDKVYLCLDGVCLPKLPWHSILPEYEVQVLPSLIDFGKIESKQKNQGSGLSDCVYFSLPVFSDSISTGETEEEKEKMELALLVSNISRISFHRFSEERVLQIYEGTRSARSTLISVRPPLVLHIAAHGKYFHKESEYPTSIDRYQKSVMFLSGEDTVTISDIMQMDLFGTELVVLNSCNTGVGKFCMDEGVYGFARAFFIAGAKYVLTCLWEIDACFSVIFLDIFYEKYFAGLDVREALRQSREFVRKMTWKDAHCWMESRKEDILSLWQGEKVYAKMERFLSCLKKEETSCIFDNPFYWGCFTLSQSHGF